MLILFTTQYFRGVYIIYTMHYAVFFWVDTFGGYILFVLCTTQYFRGMDTIYTMHYPVFRGGR